ncbi:MAG: ABC transporter ATP-binding protein [Spirochaetales bacterium]|nr:ABC transporter ATP-binding protein [Spirochaetales bacterium]
MAEVRISNLTKTFGGITAVDNVSFETREGEFFFLLGPSGAGKSTIFNLIAGITPITEGDIFIGNKKVNNLKPGERNVAVAFESYALYPNRTVYQNIRFPLDAPVRKKDLSDSEKDKMVRDMAKLLQIDPLLDRYPKELSGGQRQRVSLGRTLIRRPNVYLLDEPIAHLDAKLRHQMRRELKRLQQEQGVPAIFATPDQSEAVAMADRIAVLDKGRIQQIGTPKELYFNPINTFVASSIGEPKITFIEAEIERKGNSLYLQKGNVNFKIPPKICKVIEENKISNKVIFGIRYSDLEISFEKKQEEGYLECIVDFYQINGEKVVITAVHDELKLVVVHELDRDKMIETGNQIWLKWESQNPYLFDCESGENLIP